MARREISAADLIAAFKRGERDFTEVVLPYGADLRGADLSGADLSGADLSGADLRGAAIVVFGLRGEVVVYHDEMVIGCQAHSHDKWRGFTDNQINVMALGTSLPFWNDHKVMLLALCDKVAADKAQWAKDYPDLAELQRQHAARHANGGVLPEPVAAVEPTADGTAVPVASEPATVEASA